MKKTNPSNKSGVTFVTHKNLIENDQGSISQTIFPS